MENVNTCIDGNNEMLTLLEEVQQILNGKADLNKHRKKLTESLAKIMHWTKEHHDFDEYYDHFSNMLVAMQDFDFSYRFPTQPSKTILDFIASGLNILNEELEDKVHHPDVTSFLIELGFKDSVVIITDKDGFIRSVYNHENFSNKEIIVGSPIGSLINHYDLLIKGIEVKKCVQEIASFNNTEEKMSLIARIIKNDSTKTIGIIHIITKRNASHSNDVYRASEFYNMAQRILKPVNSFNMLAAEIKKETKKMLAMSSALEGSATSIKELFEENYTKINTSAKLVENRIINFNTMIEQILDLLNYREGFEEMDFKINIINRNKFCAPYFMIYEILHQLIANTIQYRKIGQINSVQLNVKDNLDGIQLRIVDTGVGMTKEQQVKAYESSNIKEYVHKLNGQMSFTSTLNKGSVVDIRLSSTVTI